MSSLGSEDFPNPCFREEVPQLCVLVSRGLSRRWWWLCCWCYCIKHTQLCVNIVHIIVLYIAYIISITLFKHTQLCGNIVLYIAYNINTITLFKHTQLCWNIYVMRKVRNWTIRGFCCANLGSELLCNNPRIMHANLRSEDLLRKPRIRGFAAQTWDPHAIFYIGSRNQTSAIRGNKPTIDRARKAARPSVSTKLRSIAHAKQFGHPWQRSHNRSRTQSSSAIRGNEPTLPWMAELLCLHNRLWVCCHGWPRFGWAILDDCVRIRGLRSKSLDPTFACAILALLCKAWIRGLRSKILGWSESVLCA